MRDDLDADPRCVCGHRYSEHRVGVCEGKLAILDELGSNGLVIVRQRSPITVPCDCSSYLPADERLR